MRRKLTLLRICVIFLSFAPIVHASRTGKASPALQLAANDWPMLMHDPSHSGYTDESIAPEPLTGRLNVKWKVGLGERVEIEAQPIVAYGKVYIGVMNGKFHAINADSGQIDWTFVAGGAIPHTAAAANGKVYFGCEDGRVYALDASTGELIWSYHTDGPVFSSPTVVDNVVYIGSFDTHLYALDAGTGDLHWRYKTGGKVWTSPAVIHGRVYFGSEDMHAYCLSVTNGSLVWRRNLSGVSMRNTYPVVSHGVAIFTTIKPGKESYMPSEDFEPVQGLTPEQAVNLWNAYYQEFPERRYLFYLDAGTGKDKWDPVNKKYVPFPLPYWGLIIPLVDADGVAWFPASGGGGDHTLDHNDRLWKINLADGTIFQAGSQDEYMMQPDETGRHTMGGSRYYQTAQMNVGLFDIITKQKYHIFGGPWWPYGEPLDPTPTIHKNRYGGAGWSMWHVGASSPLIIANGVGYYTAYSWLYALTSSDATEHGVVDLGTDHTLGAPHTDRTYGDFVDELNWRVEQIVASGPLMPQPIFWGYNRATLHLIWRKGEAIVSLAQTMPYLRVGVQEDLKAYLKTEVMTGVFGAGYDYRKMCMVYGKDGVIDPCSSEDLEREIGISWFADNLNVIAEDLYAAWAYAHYTGDWQTIIDHWDLLSNLYGQLANAFDDQLGFYVERNPDGSAKRWHTPEFEANLQIAAIQSVSRMAEHMGDMGVRDEAYDLLQRMYESRLELGEYVQDRYSGGVLRRAEAGDLEPLEILPWQGYRDRDTDSRQVFWTDGARWEIFSFPTTVGGSDSGIITSGQGNYSDLIGYRPMFPELGMFLREHLRGETEQYVQTVTNLNPWWYWNDATHCMQISGENLYNLPHLSSAIFQARAYILREDFDTLKDYLPWEYTAAGFGDVYRLQDLVALLQSEGAYPEPSKSVVPGVADYGQSVTYTISLVGIGTPLTITSTFPHGLGHTPRIVGVEPDIGQLQADSVGIKWSGTPLTYTQLTLSYVATVITTTRRTIVSVTTIQGLGSTELALKAVLIANGSKVCLPMIMRDWDWD
jgi:outer membrane protein assembly factor BamB